MHIGCGKTGSSALQVWLNQNADILKENAVYYPRLGQKRLDDYSITSGNGGPLVRALLDDNIGDLLDKLESQSDNNILISTEVFQTLSTDDIQNLKKLLVKREYKPVVIAYVRDLYDMLFSSYQQLIKRGLLTRSFRDYAFSINEMQQFSVVRRWVAVFDDIKLYHYDHEKYCLSNSFCEALNLPAKAIPEMSRSKVNRSLTLEELELVRYLNSLYVSKFDNPSNNFSVAISDALIMHKPEELTPILYDKDIINYISSVFEEDIKWVNDRLCSQGTKLKVFDEFPEKMLVSEHYVLDGYLKTALHALFDCIGGFIFGSTRVVNEKLTKSDPRIADLLRNEAKNNELISIEDAYTLMKAARYFRPEGPYINQKVAEYEQRLVPTESR